MPCTTHHEAAVDRPRVASNDGTRRRRGRTRGRFGSARPSPEGGPTARARARAAAGRARSRGDRTGYRRRGRRCFRGRGRRASAPGRPGCVDRRASSDQPAATRSSYAGPSRRSSISELSLTVILIIQPSPYGSLLTSSGLADNALLLDVTVPVNGANRSLTAL